MGPSGYPQEIMMLAQRVAFRQPRHNASQGNGFPHTVAPLDLETWLPRCRVLVVDDDAFSRKCLHSFLQRERYDVQLASSGEEALRLMQITPCDLVLTDWQMPDMDGLALCRSLRRTYQPGDVYILLLTVRRAEQDRRIALTAGADDFVIKCAPIRHLLERLNIGRAARSRRSFGPAGRHSHTTENG
jgi:DNA-binding response OmpR family regulator